MEFLVVTSTMSDIQNEPTILKFVFVLENEDGRLWRKAITPQNEDHETFCTIFSV